MKHCDIATIPLSGKNLIEASAGTGKTYTICGLVLRLLLEQELAIEDILVVTYTEAATEELRERVRTIIRDACEVMLNPVDASLHKISTNNDLIAALSERYSDENERARARDLLVTASRNFDQTAIFTIHGFCQRMLQAFSLESGAPLSADLLPDETELLQKIVNDFWRKRIYCQDGLFPEFLHAAKIAPPALLRFARQYANRPVEEIIPGPDPARPEGLSTAEAVAEAEFLAAFSTVSTTWDKSKEELEAILFDHPGLNRTRYGKKHIPGWLGAMDTMLSNEPAPALFPKFIKFTAKEIKKATKSGHSVPEHDFFIHCQALLEAAENVTTLFNHGLIALKRDLLIDIHSELAQLKEQQGFFSFNDLLTWLRDGLTGVNGPHLAQAISSKYPVALIDEFQDTDPVQSEIFARIYQKEGTLFLIGDPKQAIYSFRGADIFAYLDSAQTLSTTDTRYTLDTNYRSATHLVSAVNTLFSRTKGPFLFNEITFNPVLARKQGNELSLNIDNNFVPPFTLWFFKRPPDDQKLLPKNIARARILNSVTMEIVRLLTLGDHGRARIGDTPLNPADIAVLVRTNSEARLVQKALSQSNVPSVLHSSESLFASAEAADLELLLIALLNTADEGIILAALTTELFSIDSRDIFQIIESREETISGLVSWQEFFLKARALWERNGILAMFRSLMADHELRARILRFPDGERRLTNYLHLVELLGRMEYEENLSTADLLQTLIARIRLEGEDQEHQLRLESDARCVRIVTIHKSKGLEYPIVFCPFAWEGRKSPGDTAIFHSQDSSQKSHMILDLGSPYLADNQKLAAQEELAENLRLLYVALTRGKTCCYFAWGAFNNADTSAAAYLLHQQDSSQAPAPAETAARFRKSTDEELLADLQALEAEAPQALHICEPPIAPTGSPMSYQPESIEKPDLVCPVFTGKLERDWRVTSFSALTAGHYQATHVLNPDRKPVSQEPSAKDLFSFPAGTRAGIFFHSLLEELDFSKPPPEGFISEMLTAHNYDPSWESVLTTMFEHLRNIALPVIPGVSANTDTKNFCLKSISADHRINEMEFTFPLDQLSVKKLKNAFASSHDIAASLSRLDFPQSQGFIKGFIDLTFEYQGRYYLVDWKSNLLGTDISKYHNDLLTDVMNEEFYTLQYHLYAVALHRFLGARLPGYTFKENFGGVFYIFLRGIDREMGSDYGVFQERPSEELIQSLSAALSEDLIAETDTP